MRGFPQFLATKQDYLNCLSMYPDETKSALRRLLADRYTWENVGEVESEKKGKSDESHRVIVQVKTDENGQQTEYFMQQERKEDANARLFMLGFTVKEIKSFL